jgi:hypothetical protein
VRIVQNMCEPLKHVGIAQIGLRLDSDCVWITLDMLSLRIWVNHSEYAQNHSESLRIGFVARGFKPKAARMCSDRKERRSLQDHSRITRIIHEHSKNHSESLRKGVGRTQPTQNHSGCEQIVWTPLSITQRRSASLRITQTFPDQAD